MTIFPRRKRIISAVTLLAVGFGLSTIASPAKASLGGDDGLLNLVYSWARYGNDAYEQQINERFSELFIRQLQDYGSYYEGRDLSPSHNSVPTQGASLLDEPKDGMDVAFGNYSYGEQTGGDQTGLSAGDQFSDGVKDKLSMWFNYYRNSFGSSYTASTSSGNSNLFSLGADWKYSDRLLYGVGIGFNRTFMDGHTFGAQTTNEVGSTGHSITPYISYLLGNYYGIDWGTGAAFTYGVSNLDLRTGNTRGESQSRNYSGSVTLNGSKWFDRFNVLGKLAYTRSHSVTDEYIITGGTKVAQVDIPLGRISVGGRVSYYFPVWMPYVGATFNYDHLR
ncbi:MAG: autotransporter domain-containing protein, partial [Rhodospirillaceae bacterium]|nr:autotransporter domain-containing protein [Rhodospirillaceae bacterium]